MQAKKRSSPKLVLQSQTDLQIINDLKVALYLLGPEHTRTMTLFIESEVSVSQAAEHLRIPFRSAYTLVKRLERYGLIQVVRLERRDGRPVRFYRSVAKKFFIPKTLVPIEQVMNVVNGNLEQVFAQSFAHATWGELSSDGGIQFWLDEHDRPQCLLVEGPDTIAIVTTRDHTATYGMWHDWNLDFEDAKALQKELFALSGKYAQRSRKGTQSYLVRLAMTPVQQT